jgi:type II secretory pathway component PulK
METMEPIDWLIVLLVVFVVVRIVAAMEKTRIRIALRRREEERGAATQDN